MTRLLVVDDEAIVRRSIRRCLTAHGYEVIEAANATEGIERYRALQPDLVITDIRMKGMDGMEMLAEIRRTDPAARAILVSGALEGPDGCADPLLPKPFGSDQLIAVVDTALREKSA
jgi:two-component system KDP operon response regulator KdpE